MTRLFEEMTPPPTEPGAHILIVSYAGFTGEGEPAGESYKCGLKGKRIHRSLECYRAQGLFMFWSHKKRQPWQLGGEGRVYYEEQARILRPNTFARLHRNEWVSSESVFILPSSATHSARILLLSAGVLYLGVDVGVKSDNAAVVGVSWDKQGQKIVIATHKTWRPTRAQPVNLQDIEITFWSFGSVTTRESLRRSLPSNANAAEPSKKDGGECRPRISSACEQHNDYGRGILFAD